MESLGSIIAYFIIAIAIIVFSVLAVTSGKILRAATEFISSSAMNFLEQCR